MRKYVALAVMTLAVSFSWAQDIHYNIDDGYVAEGYDVVAYFNKKAVSGKKQYQHTYGGAKYKFSSQANLDKFKANPIKYVPQYGGWCAYAMGTSGDKVEINPKTYEIRDGKLYLFYNAFFNNTLDSWKEEGPQKLKAVADKNWEKVKYKD